MTRHRNIDPLKGHRVPGPAASLESQVVAAATAALRDGTRATVWERLWTSRPLRVAWSVAVLGLLAGHAAMTLSRPDPDGAAVRLAAADPSAELREELAMPKVDISARAEALAMGRRPAAKTTESAPADTEKKQEVPS